MKPIATYQQALTYIFSHTNFERTQMPKYNMTTLDLSRVTGLLAQVGNPHQQYPVLLIAGSKGKGSTSAMCDSILRAAGYKTGHYISPHLHTFRERIRVGGELISQEAVIDLVNKLRPHCDQIPGLTAWEIMTSMAFITFAQANIALAVLEVGLGGRLDATNVTQPTVSVITSISYDHTHLLGNTLTLIAREKAGIIRKDGLVVSAPQFPEAMSALEAACAEKNAQLRLAPEENPWQTTRITLQKQTLTINQKRYTIPLLGEHQAANAATALTAVQAIQKKLDLTISSQAYQTGLAQVNWPGRLEILNQAPFVVVDSAMNGDSALKLRQALRSYFPGRAITLIFGASNDHDYPAMLRELLPVSQQVILTQANHPRATRADVLQETAQSLNDTASTISTQSTIVQALEQAIEQVEEPGLICVAGSLFCAAEARLAWFQRAGLPLPPTDPV